MAIEVFKGEGYWSDQTTNWSRHFILEFAKAISQSASWNIIDSYEPTVGRIIGDPITGLTWSGQDKTNIGTDSWFVAQQVNPSGGKPAMEFKLQVATDAGNLNEASGDHYRYDQETGSSRDAYVRFSPKGGWDNAPKSGTVVQITGTQPNMTIETADLLFTADDVGRAISVSGMPSGGNNVEAEILEVISTSEVRVSNATGVAESGPGAWTFYVDFSVPKECGDNNQMSGTHDGSGDDGQWYFLLDNDYVIFIMFNTDDSVWFSIPLYIADYNPKTAAQDSVDNPARLMMCGDRATSVATRGIGAAGFLREEDGVDQLVGCLDENGEYQEWPWICPPTGLSVAQDFFRAETQPNEWDSVLGIDLMEIVVQGETNSVMTSNGSAPDKRNIGSLKHVWKTWGIGNAGFLNNRAFLTLGANEVCVAVPWDGVSSL